MNAKSILFNYLWLLSTFDTNDITTYLEENDLYINITSYCHMLIQLREKDTVSFVYKYVGSH